MVDVAVVSCNTRDLLLRCLRSLAPEVEAGRARVWVVDNASDDGSAAAARREAPWARVMEPGENLGFGRAVNLVAARSDGDWVAATNADIALTPGALDELIATGSDPRVGAVAPRLVFPDGITQQSVHRFPSLGFALRFNLGVTQASRRVGDRFLTPGRWDVDQGRDVDWALGAFLLLRRSAFERVGGFDARQWMYAEDLELCWRLHDAGFVTRYAPHARVLHEAESATAPAFGRHILDRQIAATYEVIGRRRGVANARAIGVVNALGAAVRMGLTAPVALLSPGRRAAFRAYRGWLAAHLRGGIRSRPDLLASVHAKEPRYISRL